MLKKTKIMLAVALMASTPGIAYAAKSNSSEQCVFSFHNGGFQYMSCLLGVFH